MKSIFKSTFFLSITILLFFTACQDEVNITTQEDPQTETFTATSNIASLMMRTSTNDGSSDNIIDGASCISLQLPLTVYVNGLEITIDSEDDFEVIEAIFDQLDDDDDTIDILFPITIILSDYTEVVIENQAQLETYIDECFGDNEDDDDIECVDFAYPISYAVFNTSNNDITTVTVNSDEEMYEFIESLEGTDVVSLNFPVTLIYANGETQEINNNTELENAIESAINLCDEDDDNDYGDDDFTIEQLNELLVICPWIVHSVEINQDNLTDIYENFTVTFFENGEATVTRLNGDVIVGTWELIATDYGIVLELSFDTLTDFTLTWFVEDIGGERIKLYAEGGNHIILEKNCNNNNPTDCTEEQVDVYLMNCVWNVVNFNGSDDLINYDLDFKEGQELIITNTTTNDVINATWSTSQSTEGVIVEFNNISGPNIQAISGNWIVTDCENDRFEMHHNTTNDEMVIEKNCSSDTDDLTTIITDGHWLVANFNDSGESETSNYDGYQLTFNTDGIVIAVNDANTFTGTWSTTVDDGQLKMILDFDNQVPFDEFNEDWIVFDIDAMRIELKTLDNGNIDNILVFEKL